MGPCQKKQSGEEFEKIHRYIVVVIGYIYEVVIMVLKFLLFALLLPIVVADTDNRCQGWADMGECEKVREFW